MNDDDMRNALDSLSDGQKRLLSLFVSHTVAMCLYSAVENVADLLGLDIMNEEDFHEFMESLRRFQDYEENNLDESPLEETLRRALQENGLWFQWDFQQQYNVANFRVDFAVPEQKVIVECIGLQYHSGANQVAEDARRYTYFASRGWNVLIFSGNDILNHTDDCVQTIRYALEEHQGKKTNNFLDNFLGDVVRVMNVKEIQELCSMEDTKSREVAFSGTIIHVHRQNSPRPWWIHVEDETGTLTNCSVFPESRQMFQEKLQNGMKVTAFGKISKYGEGKVAINLTRIE